MNRLSMTATLLGIGLCVSSAHGQTAGGYINVGRDLRNIGAAITAGGNYTAGGSYTAGSKIDVPATPCVGSNVSRNSDTKAKPDPNADSRSKRLKDADRKLKDAQDRFNDWINRKTKEHDAKNLQDQYLPGWIYEGPNTRRRDTEYENRQADVKHAETAWNTARALLNQPLPEE